MDIQNNNSFIFIGSPYPKTLKTDLLEKQSFVDFPADILQYAILKGLDENICDVRVLSSVRISGYPLKEKVYFKPFAFSHNNKEEKNDYYVGGINLPVINRIYAAINLSRNLRKLTQKEKYNVLVYAIGIQSLVAVSLYKKRFNSITLIVPDLPEFMSENRSWLYRIGKKIIGFFINRLMHNVDNYVLLSPYMCERLPINNKPWLLMEGIYDESTKTENISKCRECVLLYAGNLSKRYGILELIEAFHQIENDNYRLWICGDGDGKEDVLKMAEIDKRIIYKGLLSHDEVLVLQRQATVLINPRSSKGEYTKYSFPSKTMEYLASGTPTIMSHLPAIPEEYNKYIYYFTDETVEGMKERIVEVCSKKPEELELFGKQASGFIHNNKTPKIQIGRVLGFVSKSQKTAK